MGKRTREKTDEEIERKIKRLEEELKSRKATIPPAPIIVQNEDEWDSYHASSYNYRDEVELDDMFPFDDVATDQGLLPNLPYPVSEPDMPRIVHTEADIHAHPLENMAEDSQRVPETVQNLVKSVIIPCDGTPQAEDDVPDEIMDVLGEAKKSEENFGKKIPQGISERWGNILVDGLAKENRETLLSKSLIIPENFQLAKAPKLNAEVASVITDPAKNRDKRLERLQNQLGSGIAGLANLTTELINKDLDKMDIIKRISEVNQILLDLHHEDTQSRRRLIIPMLDKIFINIIQNVKRDKFLFGDNLGDNIKTSKSIEKSSLQIKKPDPPHPQPGTSRKPLGQTGNLRVPARLRQASGAGAARAHPYPSTTSRYYPQYPQPAPGPRRPPPMTNRRPPPPPRQNNLHDHRSRRQ